MSAKHRKAWQKANRKKASGYQRMSRYKKAGLTPPYPAPECCEACGEKFERTAHGACLDHCHITNEFRGWLCMNCNSALGMVGDTPEGVRKLLKYITSAYEKLDQRILS